MTVSRPKIGLALGSGGARGWAHIGVLRALRELGIWPDIITGSSIGAMVGAFVAADAFDRLEKELATMTRARMARFFIEAHLPRRGLFSGQAVTQWLERPDLLGVLDFEQLSKPFAVVATDLRSGHPVVLRKGNARFRSPRLGHLAPTSLSGWTSTVTPKTPPSSVRLPSSRPCFRPPASWSVPSEDSPWPRPLPIASSVPRPETFKRSTLPEAETSLPPEKLSYMRRKPPFKRL